jgi:hypothetical protein
MGQMMKFLAKKIFFYKQTFPPNPRIPFEIPIKFSTLITHNPQTNPNNKKALKLKFHKEIQKNH